MADHRPEAVIADKGYDKKAPAEEVERRGAEAVTPTQKGRREQREIDRHLYRERNRIERLWSKIKQYRRVATRYEKTARNFLAFVKLAAMMVDAAIAPTSQLTSASCPYRLVVLTVAPPKSCGRPHHLRPSARAEDCPASPRVRALPAPAIVGRDLISALSDILMMSLQVLLKPQHKDASIYCQL